MLDWQYAETKLCGRKCWLAVNEQTHYCLLMFACRKQKPDRSLWNESLRESLLAEGLSPIVVEAYCPKTSLSPAEGVLLAECNRYEQVAKWLPKSQWDLKSSNQPAFSLSMGMWFTCLNGCMVHPRDELLSGMAQWAETQPELKRKPLLAMEAYRMKVTHPEERGASWRRFIMPAGTDFIRLSFVVNDLFGRRSDEKWRFLSAEGETIAEQDRGRTMLKTWFEGQNEAVMECGETRFILKVERRVEHYRDNCPKCIAGGESAPKKSQKKREARMEALRAANKTEHPTYGETFSYGGIKDKRQLELLNIQLRGTMGKSK